VSTGPARRLGRMEGPPFGAGCWAYSSYQGVCASTLRTGGVGPSIVPSGACITMPTIGANMAPARRGLLEQDQHLRVRIGEAPEFLLSEAVLDCQVRLLHFNNDRPMMRAKRLHARIWRNL